MEFKLPIQYIPNYDLSKTIRDDIEMNTCYQKIIGDSSLLEQWTNYYTTNKNYLEDTQQIIKHIDIETKYHDDFIKEYDTFYSETNFNDKYQYINIKVLEPLNHSILFLQALSL